MSENRKCKKSRQTFMYNSCSPAYLPASFKNKKAAPITSNNFVMTPTEFCTPFATERKRVPNYSWCDAEWPGTRAII